MQATMVCRVCVDLWACLFQGAALQDLFWFVRKQKKLRIQLALISNGCKKGLRFHTFVTGGVRFRGLLRLSGSGFRV